MTLHQNMNNDIYYNIDEAINGAKQHYISMQPRRVSVDDIIKLSAHLFGVAIDDIKGKSRLRVYALPRQLACYLARRYCKNYYGKTMSFNQIGRVLGRDHSTVMHGCDIMNYHLNRNNELSDIVKYACTLIDHSLECDGMAS